MKTLVVLPYKQKGSQGNELSITLRGWRKFCQFDYHFIIIGEFEDSLREEYPWVEFIYSKCKDKIEGQYNQHIDVQHCMEIVMDKYSNTYNGFIWIADDNYAIKPFTLEDITTVHYLLPEFVGKKEDPVSYWRHDKWKTRQLLDRENLPHINYTTHYPCYLEFDKLKVIWDKYNMRNVSYVLEDIYYNYFDHEDPIQVDTIRLGVWDDEGFIDKFREAVDNPNIKFMCNSVEGWSVEMEVELVKLLK
jgi:hypothetical protein